MNAFRFVPKRVIIVLLMAMALLPASVAHMQEDTGLSEAEAAHAEALTRIGDEALEQGNDAVLDEFLADGYVVHSPFGDMDQEGVRSLFAAMRAAFSGFQVERQNMVLQDDFAAMRTILSGTFDNDFVSGMGVFPPNGQPVLVELINIFQFDEAGLITEEWVEFDNMSFLTQIGAMPAPAAEAEGVLTEEAMTAFVEQFDAIFDGPDNLDIADAIFAPDFVGHLPLAPELDRDGWKAYVTDFWAGVPDATQEVNQVIIADDRLIVHVTYNGMHTGTLFGVPATGNPISMNGIGIFRFNEDGLAVENWAVLDLVGVLAQIGAFPPAQ
ncbi:MAG TPA: ester cyclase family protein [Candidatus Limnocylindrales bacterium]|nr:ester cyclase family protein [Candidatus Limnocylindrales bacterium]